MRAGGTGDADVDDDDDDVEEDAAADEKVKSLGVVGDAGEAMGEAGEEPMGEVGVTTS